LKLLPGNRVELRRQLQVLEEIMMKSLTGALAVAASAQMAIAQIAKFEHVVVIVQENRTPDNLFQGLCAAPLGHAQRTCSTWEA
jgi:phospholipase C